MNPDPLDDLLSAYAKQRVPTQSNATRADILAAIRQRRSASGWRQWFTFGDISDLFAKPVLTAPALAFAALIGVVPAVVVAKGRHEERLATTSIHFEAFSPRVVGVAMLSGHVGRREIDQ